MKGTQGLKRRTAKGEPTKKRTQIELPGMEGCGDDARRYGPDGWKEQKPSTKDTQGDR